VTIDRLAIRAMLPAVSWGAFERPRPPFQRRYESAQRFDPIGACSLEPPVDVGRNLLFHVQAHSNSHVVLESLSTDFVDDPRATGPS
jgi:hypothetical protein